MSEALPEIDFEEDMDLETYQAEFPHFEVRAIPTVDRSTPGPRAGEGDGTMTDRDKDQLAEWIRQGRPRHTDTEPGLPADLARAAACPPPEAAVLRRALDLACELLALGGDSGKATRLAAEFEARARRKLADESRP